MAFTAIVHIQGEDAFAAELDELPNPSHNFLMMRNMRKKDGKPLPYVADEATAVLYSWNRITFVELMGDIGAPAPGAAAKPAGTTVLGFFRDEDN
jgi:hypothetical protein